ncbi:MAG: hypothetical protein LLG42_03940, partial [Chloroflexi bacterium]|nr:hypothetical protein [Chloroflexota bacterium]
MLSVRAIKSNKRLFSLAISLIVIITMLMSPANFASAQGEVTTTPDVVPTEADTLTPEPTTEPVQTEEPTAEPTQTEESPTPEPTSMEEPTAEPTPESTIASDETSGDLPNIQLAAPEGWEAPLVLSLQPGSHVNDMLTNGEQEYLDLAVFNNGPEIITPFTVCLDIDGEQVQCWDVNGLAAGAYFLVEDWQYTADHGDGSHYFELIADVNNTVMEADETDNTWAFDFYWQPSELDTLSVGSPLINDAFEKMIPPGMSLQNTDGSNLPGYIDTSAYMIGSVAVGVILPESAGSSENWTTDEKNNVTSEIQQGVNRWTAWSTSSGDFVNKDRVAANVSFVYEFNYSIPTTVEPITLSTEYECTWISQVLANMGFTNPNGCAYRVYDYLDDLRTRQGTDWATVIFVVDSSADYDGTFSDGYFAYAYLNGPLIVMTYDNDGWNIGRMDQVVQHEMGHIFGAGDNYYQANYGGCTSTTKQYGYLGIPNKNCMYNNPSAITNVLMNDNTIDRNHWTGQYQVGWRDSDGDTIADVVDTLPKFTMTGLDESLNLTGVLNDEPYPASTWYGVDVTINTIASARYRVDTGDWLPLSAADGTFDTDSEGISFSLDGIGNGKHSLEIEGSNTRGNTYIATVSLEAPNDRMANATAMKLNTVYSSITRWGAVTADEPVNVCNSGDTSSVWYKFTAPSKGVYRLNAYGSNYSPNLTVVKKGTGTATTPVVCGETNTEYEYSSQLSFNAAASATYLIGVSGGTDSTNLSLKIEKLTCPSGAICGAVVGGDGSVLHSPALEIYNTAGTYVGNGQGEYSGFIAGTVVGTKSASYKIITAKEGSLIVNKGVVVPGYYTPSAVGLPKTLVNVLDTTGAEIAVDSIAVVSQADNEIGAFLDGTEVGQPLTLYAAAGTYNLFAASDAAGLEVYQPGVAIVSSSNPGTVTLNASALPQDTFSFVLDEITSSAVWIYSPDGYGHEMAVNTNRTITFAAPVNTSIPYISYEYYKTDAANLLWNCYMFLSDPGNEVASIAGGDDHPYQFGGTLSVAPYLSDARFRLDEGHGEIYAGVMDGYGHKINQIYYYGYSTSGSSMQSANDRSQFIADLTTHETGDGEVLYRPLHDPDVLNAQSWVYENVVPTFTVTDALSNPVSTSSVPFLNSPSSFNIASTNPTGTWTVNESVDLGEFGGEKTGSTTFEVYSLADHPLANDDVGQAVIIPALLPSPFTATGVDTMGCTTATNDPLIAALKSKGYASVWYKYVADHDGILTLDTFGSKYDTVLNVWQGAPGSFVNRAYNDDFIDEMGTRYTSSRLNVDVRLGQTYYIEVTQYASASDENLAVQSMEAAPKPDGDVEIQQIGGELDLRASLNPCYSLTVTASPATSGKITRSPAANCLGTKYANGTKITLTAVPIAKYGFLNWSNSVSINPYDFKISGDTSLKGEFIYLAAPVLTSPASGQLTNNNMTTFTWKAVTYGSTYEIQIDNLATFANPIELTATPSELAYTASPALTDGLKYWRVRTISSRGEPGAWSAVRSFRVDTVPPSAPALLSPAVSATVRGTPAYTWSIPAGAKAYQFEYASDTEFASAIHTSAVLTSAKYIPPTQDLGTYYWHVKARDAAGNWSNWSAARSVTITTPIPVAPILVSPAAGAFVTTSTPTFTWNAAPY